MLEKAQQMVNDVRVGMDNITYEVRKCVRGQNEVLIDEMKMRDLDAVVMHIKVLMNNLSDKVNDLNEDYQNEITRQDFDSGRSDRWSTIKRG